MGQTGRRAGAQRNCLFPATRDKTLIQAAGLIDLFAAGYVEPVVPPPEPYHILAKLAAHILQNQLADVIALRHVLAEPARFVICSPSMEEAAVPFNDDLPKTPNRAC